MPKGFYKEGGRTKPISERKGITEKDFSQKSIDDKIAITKKTGGSYPSKYYDYVKKLQDRSTNKSENKREQITYENRHYDIYAKDFDEDGVENFIKGYIDVARRNNPTGRITLERSITIQQEKLPVGMVNGYMFTVGDVLTGGELLVLDQFWVFENKNKKYTIAKI